MTHTERTNSITAPSYFLFLVFEWENKNLLGIYIILSLQIDLMMYWCNYPPLCPPWWAAWIEPSASKVSLSLSVWRQLERLRHCKAARPEGISPRVLKSCAIQSLMSCSTSSTWAWSRRKSRCCGRRRAWFLSPGRLLHLSSTSTDQLPSRPMWWRCWRGWSWPTSDRRWNPHWTLCYLHRRPAWEWTTTSSTCCSELSCYRCLWLIQCIQHRPTTAAEWGWWGSTRPPSPGSLTTSQADHSMSNYCDTVLSEMVVSGTGAPQGTVLPPFLFTLYTTDFQYNSGSCHLQKFSDDCGWVVGCIKDGQEDYRAVWRLCGVGRQKSPSSECDQDQRDGGGLQEEDDGCTIPESSGRGCGHGGGVQVPGGLYQQQTELEGQYQRCVQEGEESTLFLQETSILWRVQQDVGDVLQVCWTRLYKLEGRLHHFLHTGQSGKCGGEEDTKEKIIHIG